MSEQRKSTLEELIKERILRGGPITFESFMDMALYWPGMGYYHTERLPFGPEGDYYTSGHLHPIFGWTMGVQVSEMRELMGWPEEFTLIEIGPGMGYLAEGILEYLTERLNWKDFNYIIVECNPHMVERQRQLLSKYIDLIQWIDDLKRLDKVVGCIISNEVIDALPVHLIQFDGDSFKEVYVTFRDGKFTETLGPLSSKELEEYIGHYPIPHIQGYRTEVNLRAREFLKDIHNLLSEGFVITVDYGYSAREYYSEERTTGTLLCYSRHRVEEDPYINIGQQDITAHVNFTALRDWAEAIGLKNIGYCPQGTFLVSLGIERLMEEELRKSEEFLREILKIKGLLFGMGDSHKVMVHYKGKRDIKTLKGFELRNRLFSL
jgi:SAM-dependent MidA family methyltransferase